jgi:UDP-3-O-[3-hydroxymyristoyl] glucosamine N-acyltransferase
MFLSAIPRSHLLTIVRDVEFSTLGFLSSPQVGMLSFLESPRFLSLLNRTPEAVCVITTPELHESVGHNLGCALSENPRLSFHRIHSHLAGGGFYWNDFNTVIDPSALVHPRAYIAERNVRIGARTRIEANVTILERSIIGDDVLIRAGAVIGSAGFQSVRDRESIEEMVHAGGIRIANRVHVMANAVVSSAVFNGCTEIGEDTRIGNCAFVSHSASIGRGSFVGHGAVINGFVKVGRDVWIGPGASLVHGICVGNRAHVAIGSVVIGDVEPEQKISGNFAVEHRAMLRHMASIR